MRDKWSRDLNTHFTLKDCLFGSKNTDPGKYKYSGYDIGFDPHSFCSLPEGRI